MKSIVVVVLALVLFGCDSHMLTREEIARVSDICSKNGGVKHYVLFWSDDRDKYIIDDVHCEDGAQFDTYVPL